MERQPRAIKDSLYEQFARVGKALASPKRIELLELLAQAERSVESLAAATQMTLTNTSAHLQILRRCRLVEVRKKGTTVHYRLAGDEVVALVAALRSVARGSLAEVEKVMREWFQVRDQGEPISRKELVTKMKRGEVVVVDVRPQEEYAAGHIPGALSIPLEGLARELRRLDKKKEIVAYCRGPYCVLAPQAISLLHRKGFRGRRLEEGFPEWRLGGHPVSLPTSSDVRPPDVSATKSKISRSS